MLNQLMKYRFMLSIGLMSIIYTVGIILLLKAGRTGSLIELTPFTILLTTLLLLLNHEHWNKKIVLTIITIALLGLGIEIIGINTGVPFGDYTYSSVLGIQLFGTPILIGVNWLMLVYSSVIIMHQFISTIWLKALLASLLMVLLDIFIEPVAIDWNMWTWKMTSVPVQNYITWGIAAFIFSLILSFQLKNLNKNKMAIPVILWQFLFFVILGICG